MKSTKYRILYNGFYYIIQYQESWFFNLVKIWTTITNFWPDCSPISFDTEKKAADYIKTIESQKQEKATKRQYKVVKEIDVKWKEKSNAN